MSLPRIPRHGPRYTYKESSLGIFIVGALLSSPATHFKFSEASYIWASYGTVQLATPRAGLV